MKATIIGGVIAAAVAVVIIARGDDMVVRPADTADSAVAAAAVPSGEPGRGFIYGRVTTDDDGVYEGRLRFGGDEEALWTNQFNGVKPDNVWETFLESDELPRERHSFDVLGRPLFRWSSRASLSRPFMVRMGDISLIEPRGNDLWVTLKSGTRFHLDRFGADDLADGLRVWDTDRGVVDIGEWQIRSIEFLDSGPDVEGPAPLYGTVHTRDAAFTGLIQWDREACLATDQMDGVTADGELSLRFDGIRSIERNSDSSSRVTLVDGGQVVLSGTRRAGQGNRGVYVDDPRYGRVLVSWDAFERVDFGSGGAAPSYDSFAPGRPLTGAVFTRSGRRLSGRLVYDLDESETSETLDAPRQGVDYTIPFDRIASIVLADPGAAEAGATLTLRSGEVLQLELAGDLGESNAGLLVFPADSEDPAYVPWTDVLRVDIER